MCNRRRDSCRPATTLGKLALACGLLAGHHSASAQHARDTTAAIRDFDAVLAFAIQPYVYYSSTTYLLTGPMRSGRDSGTSEHGKFYKCGDDMYYGTEDQELYIQDSLYITINHERKAIDIQRVDVATKKNLDLLPLKKAAIRRLFRDRFLISETSVGADTGVIIIRPQTMFPSDRLRRSEMRLEFAKQSLLPLFMEVTMHLPEDGSTQTRTQLKEKGFNVSHMADSLNGVPYLVLNERASIHFDQIATSKEQAELMPHWTDKVSFDPISGQFQGKGDCANYRVTKTF